MAFVMVLSYSRQIFLRFFADAWMENFLRGHVAAFTAWHGVPHVLLYDNLKSAVLERHGAAIRVLAPERNHDNDIHTARIAVRL
ncbi:MAG: hypothetical protein ABSA13_18790 [Beijerinckiaceae bacterium]|jgi:transposase